MIMAENIKPVAKAAVNSVKPSNGHAQRMSFASVAAMAPPRPSRSKVEPGTSSSKKDRSTSSMESASNCSSQLPPATLGLKEQSKEASHPLNESLARLAIKDNQPLMSNVHSHETPTSSLPMRPKLDDEKTHLSFSSTKAPSLDGKSVASGTTFAMDEKESIRPDDSASVKAAEDDDSNSGPVSGDPNSRVGSEAGSKAFRDQINEISERMGTNTSRLPPQPRRLVPGMTEELRKGPSPTAAAMDSPVSISRPDIAVAGNTPMEWKYQDPDEKLLEAMKNPKDRFFLLQLEQQVISFIRDSSETILDLPPCNSFCRLLAHRLGDYYALSHYVDNSVSAVRLYRTPFCQVRAPLSDFITSKPSAAEESPIVAPSMKIMRRSGMGMDGQIGSSGATTTDNSVGASKASSDTGEDSQRPSGIVSPTESSTAKDRAAATREEREAKYKEARDRIFADWKEGEKSETAQLDETANDASRASSTSSKKKKKVAKNDDGFDSRSAYNAYYPSRSNSYYDQSRGHDAFHNSYPQQGNGQPFQGTYQPPFNSAYPPMPPSQSYQIPPQMSIAPQNQILGSPNAYHQPNTQTPYLTYGQPIPSQYYPHPQSAQAVSQPTSIPSPGSNNASSPLTRSQPQVPDPSWMSGTFQSPYQGFPGNQPPYPTNAHAILGPTHPASSVPYAYGQLPFQPNGQGVRSAHPVPGSYNRQNFNPQSRTFIPGATFASPVPAANDLTERSGESNVHAAHTGLSGVVSPGSYSVPHMAPMSVAAQLPSPFQSQHSSPRTLPPAAHLPAQFQSQHSSPRKLATQVPISQSPGQSTLSKWGNSTTLPPKPPPTASLNPAGNGSSLGECQHSTMGRIQSQMSLRQTIKYRRNPSQLSEGLRASHPNKVVFGM